MKFSRFFAIFCSTILLLLGGSVAADVQPGQHVYAINNIHVASDFELERGSKVEVLSVANVDSSIVASGQLLTFFYNGRIGTADLEFFTEQWSTPTYSLELPETDSEGDGAYICSSIWNEQTHRRSKISLVQLQDYLSVKRAGEPISDFSIYVEDEALQISDSYSWLGKFCVTGLASGTSYEVGLKAGFKSLTSSSKLEEDISISIKTRDRPASITIDSSKYIIPYSDDAVIPITTVNIDYLDISLYRVDERSIAFYGQIFNGLDNYETNSLQDYKGLKVFSQKIYLSGNLPTTKNQENTFNLRLSELPVEFKQGVYALVINAEELHLDNWDSKPTQWFVRSNIGVSVFKGLNTATVVLREFNNASPVPNANVTIVANNNRVLFEGASDTDGVVSVPVALLRGEKGNSPSYLTVSAEAGDFAFLKLSDGFDLPRFLQSGIDKNHAVDAYLTTDRGLYRVGDEIHFSGVLRTLDLNALSVKDLDAILVGPDGRDISTLWVTTDRFGFLQGSFELSASARLGLYSIVLKTKDDTLVAKQVVRVNDFVPLTVDTKINIAHPVLNIAENYKVEVSAEYFSGGAASKRKGEFSVTVRARNASENPDLDGYVFGTPEAPEFNRSFEKQDFVLDEKGRSLREIDLPTADQFGSGLYEVLLQAFVFDASGRPNGDKATIPLNTRDKYVGLRPLFKGNLGDGAQAQFDIAVVNRAGNILPFGELPYKISRIRYYYNWYYENDNGWRWRRIRHDTRLIETGVIRDSELNSAEENKIKGAKSFSSKTFLNWGAYEISITDQSGFETTLEFYVGWGADGQTAASPEELAVAVEPIGISETLVRINAPFSGKASVKIATTDILSSQTFNTVEGLNEFKIESPNNVEPGFHILVDLVRPIERGSEHLPQLALGASWVTQLSSERVIPLEISAADSFRSTEQFSVNVLADVDDGIVSLFLVDEGIHKISGFKNSEITNFFYGARKLPLDLITNYGKLIKQDRSLREFRVGGDDEDDGEGGSGFAIPRSDFIKSLVRVPPAKVIQNGRTTFEFDPAEFEGKVRVIAVIVSDRGVGMAKSSIRFSDPVSVDISMPRFVAVGDTLGAIIGLRAKKNTDFVHIEANIGGDVYTGNLIMKSGDRTTLPITFAPIQEGTMPARISASYSDMEIDRDFKIVTRWPSYPYTDLKMTSIPAAGSLARSQIEVPPINLTGFEPSMRGNLQASTAFSTTGNVSLGQLVTALDRYPYGCIEQTSSATRALIFREKLLQTHQESRTDRIAYGLERIMAKQNSDGAFGYWNRFDEVYEEYVPYAVETLMLGRRYVRNASTIETAISNGLDYLYRRADYFDPETQIYAYGLLAKSGYDVSSRSRYVIDNQAWAYAKQLFNDDKVPNDRQLTYTLINRAGLGYWLASIIGDLERKRSMAVLLGEISDALKVKDDRDTATNNMGWIDPQLSRVAPLGHSPLWAALFASQLLAELNEASIDPVVSDLLSATVRVYGANRYRSTWNNASLARILSQLDTDFSKLDIRINGEKRDVNADGLIDISLEELKNGFTLSGNSKLHLYLTLELVGPRLMKYHRNNGLIVTKTVYDRSGNRLKTSGDPIVVKQGDAFNVVVTVKGTSRSHTSNQAELIITDLLPSGFEIENAELGGLEILNDEDSEKDLREPNYDQLMDDRYMAHFKVSYFDHRDTLRVHYTMRAVFLGKMTVPDAHAEFMYAPEVNGRSDFFKLEVAE